MMLAVLLALAAQSLEPNPGRTTPWSVVDTAHDEGGATLIDPQLVALPDGTWVAGHARLIGCGGSGIGLYLSRSKDRGRTWETLAPVEGVAGASLTVVGEQLILLGKGARRLTSSGAPVVMRSLDGGTTWSKPLDETSGCVLSGYRFQASFAPTLSYSGRLFAVFSFLSGTVDGDAEYAAIVGSAALDADLLSASSWRWSNAFELHNPRAGWHPHFLTLLNPVGDGLVIHLREDKPRVLDIVDGGSGIVSRPGAPDWQPTRSPGVRTVTRDEVSKRTFAVVTESTLPKRDENDVPARNVVSLWSSSDLVAWESVGVLLRDADGAQADFGWSSCLIDGDDLIVLAAVYELVPNLQGKIEWAQELACLCVPNFRERSSGSPPLWEASVRK